MDINWSAEFVPIEDEDLANFMDKLETENIPEVFVPAVVNSQQAPVARDARVSEANVMTFIEGKKKKNTVSSTSRDVNNIRRWLAENKWELRDLEDIPVDELNRYLAQMWISIRKKKGGEYEPSSLDQMKNSLDRYLREKTSGSVTLRSTTFDLSSRSLTAKKQQLKQEGLGRRAHKSLCIDERHGIQRKGAAPQAAHKICQMTGHKNPASLKSYDDELEESEQISYSKILSNRTNSNTQIAPPMAPPVTPVMSYQQAQVQTNCTNCTFNFQVQTYPTAPKRQRAVIESDSSQSQ